jgi:hypothetical protein
MSSANDFRFMIAPGKVRRSPVGPQPPVVYAVRPSLAKGCVHESEPMLLR